MFIEFNVINKKVVFQVSVNRSGKSKVIFTMGVARDFCTKLTAFANFLAQGITIYRLLLCIL